MPGTIVDRVVLARPETHWQTFATRYHAGYSGEIRVPSGTVAVLGLDERRIITRRAAMKLQANAVINLGSGMPEGIANVATEEWLIDLITSTAKSGAIGVQFLWQ